MIKPEENQYKGITKLFELIPIDQNLKLIKRSAFQSSIKNQMYFHVWNHFFKPIVYLKIILDFRLWLNDANIREDIESLRNLNRRPNLEEEPKKNKKVKTDY